MGSHILRLAMLPSLLSVLFLSNPGLGLSIVQSCPFDECNDGNLNCLPIFSTNYTMIRKDCDGSCEYGQCLNEPEGKCHSCPYKCQHPHFCEASNRCWETLYLYEHKDEDKARYKSCGGACIPDTDLCDGSCGLDWQCKQGEACVDMWNKGKRVWHICKGECVELTSVCNGACHADQCLQGGRCLQLEEKGKIVRGLCSQACTEVDAPCDGRCPQDGKCFDGKKCADLIDDGGEKQKSCNGICMELAIPCDSKCNQDQCLKNGKCTQLVNNGKVNYKSCDGACIVPEAKCNGKCETDQCFDGRICRDMLDEKFNEIWKECNGICKAVGATC